MSIFLAYAGVQMMHMVTDHCPTFSEIYEQNFYDSTEKLNLDEIGFKFAFTLEGAIDLQMKNQEQFVKYFVRAVGNKDGVYFQKMLPYHKCTEEDWA